MNQPIIQGQPSFIRCMSIWLAMGGVGYALAVLLVSLAFKMPWRSGLIAYLGLLYSSQIMGVFVYWAQKATRPKTLAFRLAVGVFVAPQILLPIIAYSVHSADLLSWETIIEYFPPAELPVAALFGSIIMYVMAVRAARAKLMKQSILSAAPPQT
jgi:hypothetical protein